MKIKPHLFIGSSSEGLSAAQVLKTRLSSWADCDIWNEPGVFELNKGYLENLLERLNLYEYGIMVATGMTRRNRVEKRRWRHETMWYSSSGFSWGASAGTERFLCSSRVRNYRRTFWELRCRSFPRARVTRGIEPYNFAPRGSKSMSRTGAVSSRVASFPRCRWRLATSTISL